VRVREREGGREKGHGEERERERGNKRGEEGGRRGMVRKGRKGEREQEREQERGGGREKGHGEERKRKREGTRLVGLFYSITRSLLTGKREGTQERGLTHMRRRIHVSYVSYEDEDTCVMREGTREGFNAREGEEERGVSVYMRMGL